jgi:hypothetical protein
LKDGTKSGKVSGFGATITIGSIVRRQGSVEAEVEHIEGKFSITDLVDPKIKGKNDRDKYRIKALLTVRGVTVTPETFKSLFESEKDFEEIVSKSSLETTDPVEMSAKIKRDIENHARIAENQSQKLHSDYVAAVEDTEYQQENIINDLTEFNKQGAELGQIYNQLVAEKKAFESASKNIELAKKSIASIDVKNDEIRIETEKAKIGVWEIENSISQERIDGLESEIKYIQETIKKLQDDIKKSEHSIESLNTSIKNNDKSILSSNKLIDEIREKLDGLKGYKEIVEKSQNLKPVIQEEIDVARTAYEKHNDRLVKHAVALEKKRKLEKAKTILAECLDAEQRAATLREVAKNCESVLSELVGGESLLYINDGRMCIKTERGETYYDELSDGERWRTAFLAVADSIKKDDNKNALLPIPQRGWESLDPINQNLVAKLAKEHGLWIMTAATSDGDLTVEYVGGTT